MSGFKINDTDIDDIFEPSRDGFTSVTMVGYSPSLTYMSKTGDATNANTSFRYMGGLYHIHPKGYLIPKSLSYSGTWGTQTEGSTVNTSGITFTVTYMDDTTATVTPSVSPSSWSTGSGSQTATFSYTEHGVSVSTTKTCGMTYSVTVTAGTGGSASGSTTYEYSSSSQTKSISYSANSGYTFSSWSVSGGSASASGTTLTINGGSRGDITVTANFTWYTVTVNLAGWPLAFVSVSGLYTNTSCTTAVAANTYYSTATFYRKSNASASGTYLYNRGEYTQQEMSGYTDFDYSSQSVWSSYLNAARKLVGVWGGSSQANENATGKFWAKITVANCTYVRVTSSSGSRGASMYTGLNCYYLRAYSV